MTHSKHIKLKLTAHWVFPNTGLESNPAGLLTVQFYGYWKDFCEGTSDGDVAENQTIPRLCNSLGGGWGEQVFWEQLEPILNRQGLKIKQGGEKECSTGLDPLSVRWQKQRTLQDKFYGKEVIIPEGNESIFLNILPNGFALFVPPLSFYQMFYNLLWTLNFKIQGTCLSVSNILFDNIWL